MSCTSFFVFAPNAWQRFTLACDAMLAGTRHYPYASSVHDLLFCVQRYNAFLDEPKKSEKSFFRKMLTNTISFCLQQTPLMSRVCSVRERSLFRSGGYCMLLQCVRCLVFLRFLQIGNNSVKWDIGYPILFTIIRH